jgi:hypothetical protein
MQMASDDNPALTRRLRGAVRHLGRMEHPIRIVSVLGVSRYADGNAHRQAPGL